MTNLKKVPRKKSYKTMSVSELVQARKELSGKIEQIDIILNEAVEAVQSIKPTYRNQTSPTSNNSFKDSAFVGTNSNYLNAQVAVSRDAPILPNIPSTSADQSSGFSIFDAETAAREQGMIQQKYLDENPEIVNQEDIFEFNSDEVSQEIKDLKEGISKGLKDVSDS
jgi:hypothetical protein